MLTPLIGPVVISGVVVCLWWVGDPKFKINWHLLIDDLTPWALTFYAITLIGATMKDLWSKLSVHPVLGVSLLLTAFTVAVFESFIVIWRHDSQFVAGTSVYLVTCFLLGVSIYLCHKGAKIT